MTNTRITDPEILEKRSIPSFKISSPQLPVCSLDFPLFYRDSAFAKGLVAKVSTMAVTV